MPKFPIKLLRLHYKLKNMPSKIWFTGFPGTRHHEKVVIFKNMAFEVQNGHFWVFLCPFCMVFAIFINLTPYSRSTTWSVLVNFDHFWPFLGHGFLTILTILVVYFSSLFGPFLTIFRILVIFHHFCYFACWIPI
jgi:hypothetical protein